MLLISILLFLQCFRKPSTSGLLTFELSGTFAAFMQIAFVYVKRHSMSAWNDVLAM